MRVRGEFKFQQIRANSNLHPYLGLRLGFVGVGFPSWWMYAMVPGDAVAGSLLDEEMGTGWEQRKRGESVPNGWHGEVA